MKTKSYELKGFKEIMLCDCIINKRKLINMSPNSLKEMMSQKLLDESVQVFILNRDDFGFMGEKQIKSSIQYTERDHLKEIEKDSVRLVFWEELEKASVSLDIPEKINEINLVVDGNTFGCMDNWGHETFTDYSFISDGKEIEINLISESYGKSIDKVVCLINCSGKAEFIRNLDFNDDFSDELLEAFNELEIS